MVKLELDIPKDWFNAEIRDGYFVSRERKNLWAIQLDMLYKVQQICKKYNIKYWADGGTLLGAIRHNGYIPWDDDIDIAMMREDYDRFIEVAKKELNHPYFLQTDWTDETYYCHAKLRRSDTTCVLVKDVPANFEFNQGIFIDIFPLDMVPTEEEMYKKYVEHLWMIKNGLLFNRSRWWVYERDNYDLYMRCKKDRDCFEDARKIFNDTNSPIVANLSLPSVKDEIRKELSDYEKTLYAKFEMLDIPIPYMYDNALTKQYGDYLVPQQGKTKHGELLYDVEIGYKDSYILDLYMRDNVDPDPEKGFGVWLQDRENENNERYGQNVK